MTAFGKKHFSCSAGQFYLEIYSINKRNLDVNIYSPRELSMIDYHLRKWVQSHAKRGTVTIKLIKEHKHEHDDTSVDTQKLAHLKTELDQIAKDLNLSSVSSIEFLAQFAQNQPNIRAPIDQDKLVDQIQEAFNHAADNWVKMKCDEGSRLVKDMSQRLNHVEKIITDIELKIENAPQKYADKLKKRLDDAGVLEGKDDEKVIKEVVIFSEKIDTTEEIIRLKSHLKQFAQTLDSSEKAIGRKLDFIIQEMNREVNSLSVKCHDLEIIKQALEIKSEIEKVREQVQNIE